MRFKVNFSRLGSITMLVIILMLVTLASAQANPLIDPGINKVYYDTVRDVAFSISWTTDSSSDGSVTWGTVIPPSNVAVDPITNTTTHFVTISGLSPNTTYYFQVNSGTATDNNGGSYYQVTTGPTLSIPTPGKTVWGYVYEITGATFVPNAIVYLQLQNGDGSGSPGNSQWVSTRTDNSGVWSFDLVNIRTNDYQSYYMFSDGTDNLRIIGQGGNKGSQGAEPNPWIISTPTGYPFQIDITLQQNPTAVTIQDLHLNPRLNYKYLTAWLFISMGIILLTWVVFKIKRVR